MIPVPDHLKHFYELAVVMLTHLPFNLQRQALIDARIRGAPKPKPKAKRRKGSNVIDFPRYGGAA